MSDQITQMIFSLSYVPFVIFIALSCIHEEKAAGVFYKKIWKIFAVVATISYFFFLKNLII
jgi:hypothetical protein